MLPPLPRLRRHGLNCQTLFPSAGFMKGAEGKVFRIFPGLCTILQSHVYSAGIVPHDNAGVCRDLHIGGGLYCPLPFHVLFN